MFERLAIPDVFLFRPKRHGDGRGFFVETFNQALLAPMTGPRAWVQDNQSRSERRFTLRGLHFQIEPLAQDKLVRCLRGAIWDVAVDIRPGSPTFGRHVAAELTEAGGEQIFVPKGFAHGFLTLTEGCEVAYKVTNYYSPPHERGLRFDDPELGIAWPARVGEITLSDRDRAWPGLSGAAL